MSLSTLRRTYGQGTRHQVLNKAIRAECPGGNQIIDSIAALNCRITNTQLEGGDVSKLEELLAHWHGIRSQLAAELEVKHGVGPNLNRRRQETTTP